VRRSETCRWGIGFGMEADCAVQRPCRAHFILLRGTSGYSPVEFVANHSIGGRRGLSVRFGSKAMPDRQGRTTHREPISRLKGGYKTPTTKGL
jgi:hypothetical protein